MGIAHAMSISTGRLIAVVAVGAGAWWLVKARKDGSLPEMLDPIADAIEPVVSGISANYWNMYASLNDAGIYLQDAFDLANSDFKTSLTSGRGNQFTSEIEKIGAAKGLPPFFLSRIAYQESRFKPDAVNPSGARGMFQINAITQKELSRQMGREFDPYNWKQAAEAAAVYFNFLYRKFGSWLIAAAAYNAGPGAVNKNIAANGGAFIPSKMPQAEQKVYCLQVMADIPSID